VRIVILNQFFYPDHSATSQLMTDLAESLVGRGVSVTALAGRGRYNGGDSLPIRADYHGIEIVRAWASSFGKSSTIARLSDYLSFYLCAAWKLLTLPRHDIVLALTTPPLISLPALLICRLRRMKLIALVQDIYPDVTIALGTLKADSLITRVLDALNRLVLRKSDRIIVLGECMRERIAAKMSKEAEGRIDVIHNWADGSVLQPLPESADNSFADAHRVGAEFVVQFSGNLGRVNDFATVLDAAERLRERPEILFQFIGDGAKADELRIFSREHDLKNIQLLPYQPREILQFTLAAGDAHLVTLACGLSGLSVPSKTYGILAAGRPILFVGDASSDVARLVQENHCGAVIASGEGDALAQTIAQWADDRARVKRMGQTARQVFERRFDRPRAVNSYLASFARCINSDPRLKISEIKRAVTAAK
jgi:colanic acid biosynthesis glycosyl transferase WcaI